MNNYKYARISSKYTGLSFAGIIVSLLILPILGALFIYLFFLDYQPKDLILGALLLAGTYFLFLCSKHLAKVEIINNEFHIKRMFKAKEIYSIRNLTKVKVYDMGQDDYIFFRINNHGIEEKILVYASFSILYNDENIRTEEILREIEIENLKTKKKIISNHSKI